MVVVVVKALLLCHLLLLLLLAGQHLLHPAGSSCSFCHIIGSGSAGVMGATTVSLQ